MLALQDEVGMNLIGDNQKLMLEANLGDALQLSPLVHEARWILRIALQVHRGLRMAGGGLESLVIVLVVKMMPRHRPYTACRWAARISRCWWPP